MNSAAEIIKTVLFFRIPTSFYKPSGYVSAFQMNSSNLESADDEKYPQNQYFFFFLLLKNLGRLTLQSMLCLGGILTHY
jgi:hypothetical protein